MIRILFQSIKSYSNHRSNRSNDRSGGSLPKINIPIRICEIKPAKVGVSRNRESRIFNASSVSRVCWFLVFIYSSHNNTAKNPSISFKSPLSIPSCFSHPFLFGPDWVGYWNNSQWKGYQKIFHCMWRSLCISECPRQNHSGFAPAHMFWSHGHHKSQWLLLSYSSDPDLLFQYPGRPLILWTRERIARIGLMAVALKNKPDVLI